MKRLVFSFLVVSLICCAAVWAPALGEPARKAQPVQGKDFYLIQETGTPGEFNLYKSKSPIQFFRLVAQDPEVIIDPINPPDPTVPFPATKLSVLIVEETANRGNLKAAQRNAILSATWKRYVEQQDGDWASVDPDSPLEDEKAWVTEAMKVKRGELPWVVISNGRTGASGPIVDLDSLLKTIKEHGK